MKKITFYLFSFLFAFSLVTQAQNQRKISQNSSLDTDQLIRCGSDEYNAKLLQSNPEMMGSEAFERKMAEKVEEINQNRSSNQMVVVTIPIVFHVLHNGEPIGTGPNITDAQVLSQLTVMNEDYRRMAGTPGFNTNAVGADVEVEFCLAQQDPNGNPTNGINRVNIGQNGITETSLADAQNQMDALKPSSVWDPANYMNMWSVAFNGGSGLLGYAQFPGGPANTDGVVADYRFFGSSDYNDGTFNLSAPFDKGRTMTHEVGHFLGLYHTFQGGCTGTGSTGGDFCADTPAVATPNYGCVVGTNSCAADPGNDMIENYMDYTDDACMNVFTVDQKARIVNVLATQTNRASLTTSTVCTPSTTPLINFGSGTPSPGQVAEGSNCNFLDYTIDLTSTLGGSAASTVTLVNSGTAVENEDFMLMNNSVTFPMGSTTPSNSVTLRVFNDNFVETDETIVLALNLSTSGNSTVSTSTYNYVIENDDDAVTSTSTTTIFYDDFSDGDNNGWTLIDADGTADNDWTVVEEANWATPFGIYTDFFMVSYSWNGVAYTPDNFISSPLVSVPAGANAVNLRYFAGSASDATYFNENYEVYASTSIGSVANITAGTLLVDTIIPAQGGAYYDLDISAFAGQDIYISFRHHDTVDEWLLGIDEVEVTVDGSTSVQTAVNTATLDQFNLISAGLVYSVDTTTSDIMAEIDNTGGFDYGCTTVAVSRDIATAGAGAVSYAGGTNTAGYVTAKTFDITTANSGAGAVNNSFFFTEAELVAWEGITGENRSALYVKNDTTGELMPVTITAFGSESKLSATFANGLAGKYYFGTQLAFLSTGEFELASSISIYPNPTNNVLNIKVGNDNDLPNAYKVYNMLGQLVTENTINSVQDLTIDATPFSNGMYFIKISKASNSITLPFIKK
ncbi:M43 family zinc metalloprotease [Olleya sp. R77988]|uniref:M43 family zinc metalloprotease n=1 Tax=Olleya sp. R77988 TaxID=3093875 RepID=UPI0037C91A2A